jgi:hypothetical protein
MGVSRRLIELFEAGYKPVEIVRMGFPKSTVYTVYRKWLEGKTGESFIYIAHDIDYNIVKRFNDQLNLLGYKTIVGGNTIETLELLKPAKAVVGLAAEKPGFRRQLLLEEIYTASKLRKPTYVLAEKGANLPTYRSIRIVELDKANPGKMVTKLLAETEKQGSLEDLIAAIALGALVALGIVAIAKLLEEIFGNR